MKMLFLKFKNVFSIILKNNLKNEKNKNMFGKNISKNYYWNNFHKLKIKQCILIILILRINYVIFLFFCSKKNDKPYIFDLVNIYKHKYYNVYKKKRFL